MGRKDAKACKKLKDFCKKEKKKEKDLDKPWREPKADETAVGGPTTAAAIRGEGCICPIGCSVGKEITVNDVVGLRATANNSKYVKVYCSLMNGEDNKKCKFVPFMHDVCFEKWEKSLIKQLRSRRITQDWNDEKVKSHLWLADGADYCFRSRRCPCGGTLTRVDAADEELPKPTEKAEKKAMKAAAAAAAGADSEPPKKKSLPPLVTISSKVGGSSMYKSCAGFTATERAATYASKDYYDAAARRASVVARMRSSNSEEEEWKRKNSSSSLNQLQSTRFSLQGTKIESSDDEEGSEYGSTFAGGLNRRQRRTALQNHGGGPSRTTSFSSSTEDRTQNWLTGSFMPPTPPPLPYRPPTSSSGTGSSYFNGRRSSETPIDYDEEDENKDEDEEEKFLEKIREMLTFLGGSLDLNDELLNEMVIKSSATLNLAISDAGGLGDWLRLRPEFYVDLERVRLCRNVRSTPARLTTSGLVQQKTDTYGTIFCDSYDLQIYVDNDLIEAEGLHKGDIVKVEAVESPTPIEGLNWKALTVEVLQRESQCLLTAVRRSYEDGKEKQQQQQQEIKVKIDPKLEEALRIVSNRNRPIYEEPPKQPIQTIERHSSDEDDEEMAQMEEGFWSCTSNRTTIIQQPGDVKKETGESIQENGDGDGEENSTTTNQSALKNENEEFYLQNKEKLDKMVNELTKKFLPSPNTMKESGYSKALAMVKSWDASLGGKGEEPKWYMN